MPSLRPAKEHFRDIQTVEVPASGQASPGQGDHRGEDVQHTQQGSAGDIDGDPARPVSDSRDPVPSFPGGLLGWTSPSMSLPQSSVGTHATRQLALLSPRTVVSCKPEECVFFCCAVNFVLDLAHQAVHLPETCTVQPLAPWVCGSLGPGQGHMHVGQAHIEQEGPSTGACMLDELGSFLGILLGKAAQVHGLLHDVEVFVERKGHIRVTIPLKVP